jgi:hypothetical protein
LPWAIVLSSLVAAALDRETIDALNRALDREDPRPRIEALARLHGLRGVGAELGPIRENDLVRWFEMLEKAGLVRRGKRMRLAEPSFLLMAMALFARGAHGQSEPPLALTGGLVLDGTGGAPLEDGVVVIRGERIEAVGPRDRNISETRNVERVIQKGRLLDREKLRFDPSLDPGFRVSSRANATPEP